MLAANSAVSAPITATVVLAAGACAYSGAIRQVTYTPAVTIVAAWISADTGVGPSIASGSQTYSGICADFPVAPTNSSSVIIDTAPNVVSGATTAARRAISWKSRVPNRTNAARTPRMNPTSAVRLTR